MARISFSFSGGSWPSSLPLFHGTPRPAVLEATSVAAYMNGSFVDGEEPYVEPRCAALVDPIRSKDSFSATGWLILFAVVREARRDDPKARGPDIRRYLRSAWAGSQPTGRFHLRLSTRPDPLQTKALFSPTDRFTLLPAVRWAHRDHRRVRRPVIRDCLGSTCTGPQPTGRFHLRLSTRPDPVPTK